MILTRDGHFSRDRRILSSCSSFSAKKNLGPAVGYDVFDLLGRIGRVNAVGDAADAEGPHVGVEPFGKVLGNYRNDIAAGQSEALEAKPREFRPLAVFRPRDCDSRCRTLFRASPRCRRAAAPWPRTASGRCRNHRRPMRRQALRRALVWAARAWLGITVCIWRKGDEPAMPTLRQRVGALER